MKRHTYINQNSQIANENDESSLANKNRLVNLKSEALSATTPRRAFGLIKNQEATPGSTLRTKKITSISKTSSTCVREEEPVSKTNDCGADSLDELCKKFITPISPWEEFPEIETFGAVPNSPSRILNEINDSLILRNVPCFTLDELCLKYSEELEPWAPEDVPPIEQFPKFSEQDETFGKPLLDDSIDLFEDLEEYRIAYQRSDFISTDEDDSEDATYEPFKDLEPLAFD